MKAITLWEPWATAIMLGLKTYETRSWKTDYRGTIAIHASQKRDAVGPILRGGSIAVDAFRERGYTSIGQFNFGCVVCLVDIVDCIPTETLVRKITPVEYAFGNYGPGRFAWKLKNLQVFREPIPARGAQGFWHWNEAQLVGGNTR